MKKVIIVSLLSFYSIVYALTPGDVIGNLVDYIAVKNNSYKKFSVAMRTYGRFCGKIVYRCGQEVLDYYDSYADRMQCPNVFSEQICANMLFYTGQYVQRYGNYLRTEAPPHVLFLHAVAMLYFAHKTLTTIRHVADYYDRIKNKILFWQKKEKRLYIPSLINRSDS